MYKLQPLHVINFAITLWNAKQWKCNITVGYYQRKLLRMYRVCSSKWTCRLWNLGCYVAMHAQSNIYNLQKRLTQTSVDFEQNVIKAAIESGATVWDHACWWRTL